MDTITELLVGLLARTEALFEPIRWTRDSAANCAAIHERREHYRKHGLPLTRGGSGAERQAHSREMAQARAAGWITTTGTTRPSVKLTPAADDYLRALTARYRIDESWPLLELVAYLAEHGATNAGCVLEVHLLGTSYREVTSAQLARLQAQAGPLLASGLLEAHSDTQRRVGYAITAAGRETLSRGRPAPKGLPDYSTEAGELYDMLEAAACLERAEWQPETGLVVIPLSAGRWPKVEGVTNG